MIRAGLQGSGLFTDISEHKRAEAMLRESEERFRMADSAPVITWVSGADKFIPFQKSLAGLHRPGNRTRTRGRVG